jgi:predicted homoserine dehydrogenase-like protein
LGLREKLEALARSGTPIRVGVVGVGQMGRGFIAQTATIPGLEVVAAADVRPERARTALQEAGYEPGEGVPGFTGDALEVARSEVVDVLVEATGVPDVGARVAYEAIHSGRHVVMLNAEADVTVGAVLSQMARSAGIVYTGSAGDEPGAIMELYDFARSLGFEVVTLGKGKNNPLDVAATPDSLAREAKERGMNPKMLASFVDGTKTMVEMAAVANATGFAPDTPGMHGIKEAEPARLAAILCPREEGGILAAPGAVEYVRGVAPGVFAVVRSDVGPVRETLRYLGLGEGPNHVLYRPYHLTSLETAISVARAAIYGEPTIAPRPTPAAEVVAVAKRDLAAGELLDGIGGADYYGFLYAVSEARDMLPIGLAQGARIVHPVKRGAVIPRSAVELSGDSFVVRLRRLQEALVGGGTA